MRDRPTGPELLELAGRVRNGDSAVTVPADGRYKELMLANAETIAARQAEAGVGPEREEMEELSRLLGREGGLDDLNRDLARAIREGRYDPGQPGADAVFRLVWRTALARTRVSNPKAVPEGC
ncbi:MAG: DUF6285 domain-containing protein [Rhodospirillales bacterium]